MMEDFKKQLPTHVSLIMDGNGRWAKMRGKERIFGHLEGVESVRVIAHECVELGIKYISAFAFSEENWNRPAPEVEGLMKIFIENLLREESTFMKDNVRVMVLGNRARLGDKLNAVIDRVMEETSGNTGCTMILFISYSGKWDIQQAADRMAAEGGDSIEPYLVTRMAGIPDPDVIIRTSGEKRISNYMLWQAAYSEFVFTDTLWPDFRKDEFHAALEEFASRDRRYGKVK
ncbi:MAG: di-trans,poly-cis-decaprenylcistransferase [Bacteroidales bacterium]|nr:di-trans,poly-cis-decaprenylcistransferase [Bacteroidales bacterium]